MKNAVKRYTFERDYALPKEAIWKLISDNNQMNAYIGVFPVKFSESQKQGPGVFYRTAKAKAAGLVPLTWQEHPFQWEENKSYVVERRYTSGPLVSYTWGIELLDCEGPGPKKTKVKVVAEFKPRNILGMGAIWSMGVQSMKNTLAYIDEFIKVGADPANIPQRTTKHEINLKELERKELSLMQRAVDISYVQLLHQYLLEKSGHDVAHMEPVKIARQWNKKLEEVIRVLLYATKAGILNLSWNLICPNCRVSKVEYTALSELQSQFHCDLCGINYDANFDQYVELHFAVHPSIRKAYAEVYCVGAPQITPHIKAQKIIEMGQTILLTIPNDKEALRLRVIQMNDMAVIDNVLPRTENTFHLEYGEQGWVHENLANCAAVSITNSSSNDIIVALEQSTWTTETVTAAKVTAMQEFRDLFSSEVLSPGQQIGIGHVTIMFTDLKNSTFLYESVGDATAYGQVNRHFEFLTKWIAKNSGSVVKTIGDAVMAVFHLSEDGLNAALQIQQHVAEFNDSGNKEFVLKIGLYSGPAIAVNSNDRLDYFGRTVNIAARIQGQGTGGDLIISRDFLNQLNVQRIITENNFNVETFQANLKGIEEEVELARLSVKVENEDLTEMVVPLIS